MTYEEVKRIRANPSLADVDNEELARMIDEAIEKQIPKKPTYDDRDILPECPNCGSEYGVRADDYGERPCCCTICGQRISWEDENGY